MKDPNYVPIAVLRDILEMAKKDAEETGLVYSYGRVLGRLEQLAHTARKHDEERAGECSCPDIDISHYLQGPGVEFIKGWSGLCPVHGKDYLGRIDPGEDPNTIPVVADECWNCGKPIERRTDRPDSKWWHVVDGDSYLPCERRTEYDAPVAAPLADAPVTEHEV